MLASVSFPASYLACVMTTDFAAFGSVIIRPTRIGFTRHSNPTSSVSQSHPSRATALVATEATNQNDKIVIASL